MGSRILHLFAIGGRNKCIKCNFLLHYLFCNTSNVSKTIIFLKEIFKVVTNFITCLQIDVVVNVIGTLVEAH